MQAFSLQQLFPIQNLLIFPRFELPPILIFKCYRPQTSQFLFFPQLFPFLVFTKSQVLKLRMGRSRDLLLTSERSHLVKCFIALVYCCEIYIYICHPPSKCLLAPRVGVLEYTWTFCQRFAWIQPLIRLNSSVAAHSTSARDS